MQFARPLLASSYSIADREFDVSVSGILSDGDRESLVLLILCTFQ